MPTLPSNTWRAFGLGLCGLTFANLDHSLFALVLTEIKRDFGWTEAERGAFLCITFVIAGILITQVGVLADRLGRKRVLVLSMIATPLLVASMYWAKSTVALLILRTLSFTAAGAQAPVTGTLVLEESPPKYRGLISGLLQIAYPLGWAIAALALVPLVYDGTENSNWRNVFWLGLLGLPIAWAYARYLQEPAAWRAAHAREATRVTTADLFKPEYRYRTVMLLVGQFLQVFAYGATILLVAYFQEARGFNLQDTLLLVGLSYAIGSLGYILAAVVGEFWLSRRNVIVLWCWCGAAAFVWMIWGATGWLETVVSFGATTFFFYGATAVIFTFLAENFPAHLRATATSFSGSLGVNLGVAFGPLALSLLVAPLGWQWAYTWAGILPLVLAGCAYLALKPVPREDLEASAG
jgi:MFS family permease